jgi:hypothetical protein
MLVAERGAIAAPTTAEVNAARETYREGVALEAAGNWAGALTKFQAVAAVKSTPRVRFHIGLCQEKLGRWNEALGAYKMAVTEASRERAADVVKEAQAAAAKIEGRIPRLTVRRAPGAESSTISVDGVELGAASIGTEMPVDPGTHTIEIAVTGRAPRKITVEVKEGEHKSVDAAAPDAEPSKPASTAASSAPAPAAVSSQTEPARKSKAGPLILTGVGVASLVASGVFYGLRQGALNDLKDKCGADLHCSESERSIYDRGRTYTLVADVALGVGIAGVAAGAIWLLASGSGGKKESQRTADVSPGVHWIVHPSGVSVVGQF